MKAWKEKKLHHVPSRSHLLPTFLISELINAIIKSSGTKAPVLMYCVAFFPSSGTEKRKHNSLFFVQRSLCTKKLKKLVALTGLVLLLFPQDITGHDVIQIKGLANAGSDCAFAWAGSAEDDGAKRVQRWSRHFIASFSPYGTAKKKFLIYKNIVSDLLNLEAIKWLSSRGWKKIYNCKTLRTHLRKPLLSMLKIETIALLSCKMPNETL